VAALVRAPADDNRRGTGHDGTRQGRAKRSNNTQSRPRPLNQAAVSSLYPLWITGQLGSRRPRLRPDDHQPAWLAQLGAVRPMPYDCPDLMPGEGASCGHAAGAAGAASIASAVRFRGGEQQVGQCPQRQDYETTTSRRQVDETPTSWARTDTPSSAADVPASCCSASAFLVALPSANNNDCFSAWCCAPPCDAPPPRHLPPLARSLARPGCWR